MRIDWGFVGFWLVVLAGCVWFWYLLGSAIAYGIMHV